MTIADLLKLALSAGASDLHLAAELPPLLRIDGAIQPTTLTPFRHAQVHSLIYAIMNDKQINRFEKNDELDFAMELKGLARVRVNLFRQNLGMTAVFRLIPLKVPTLEELQLDDIFTIS